MHPCAPLLLIDDEAPTLRIMEATLGMAGFSNVVACHDSRDVSRLLDTRDFSAVTLDLVMPGISGKELLPIIRRRQPDASIIVITSLDDVETAVDLMKQGAFDYLVKPVDTTRLATVVNRAVENWELVREIGSLKDRLISGTMRRPEAFTDILTANRRMDGVFGYIEAIAETPLPVLIVGETGVGKELLARSVHLASGRAGDFVPVNMAGLDDQLFSDMVFGHVAGAFTGAERDRDGMIARAAGGTLFLDEIGDLSGESQGKLLRLTQEREYYPLGSDIAVRTTARFVFATNRNLEDMIRDGAFRQDLYYRLRSHQVVVPPLRERPEDISLLVDRFVERAATETGKRVPKLHRDVYSHLMAYDYPGNVRELEGLVYDAVVRHESGVLGLAHFNDVIRDPVVKGPESRVPVSLDQPADEEEAKGIFAGARRLPSPRTAMDSLIREALRRAGGNQSAAAKLIGLTPSALNKRLRQNHPPE